MLTFDFHWYFFTLTFQHGGAVPAELPEDGGTVVGGGREHKAGAVQRLHRGRQVSFHHWIIIKLVKCYVVMEVLKSSKSTATPQRTSGT